MIEHRIVTIQYLKDNCLYDSKCAVIGRFPTVDWGQIRARASGWLGRECELRIENGTILGIARVEKGK